MHCSICQGVCETSEVPRGIPRRAVRVCWQFWGRGCRTTRTRPELKRVRNASGRILNCVNLGVGHELSVMYVQPSDGISRRDLPAFSRRTGKSGQAYRLGISEGRRMPGLRPGAIRCPGSRNEGHSSESGEVGLNPSSTTRTRTVDSRRLIPYHALADKLLIAHHNFHRTQ